MSIINEIRIKETYRDRYARESNLSNGIVSIPCPCLGIGVRTKKDIKTLIKLRLTHPTERLGFCITSLANSDGTFIELKKELDEEKHKLAPTANGKQLQMFTDQTFLAVEPSAENTYYYSEKISKKILASLETPSFFKEIIKIIMKKANNLGSKSEVFRVWKEAYFEEKWLELNSNATLRDTLIRENFQSQNTCNANTHIPPTPPLVTRAMFYVATKIIEEATKLARYSTAVYFNMPFSILQDNDFCKLILDYCDSSPNKIIIFKIHDLDKLLDPDREDERNMFSEIQERMCNLRKNNRCTVLLEGGKLTVPSLTRGFDVVTNNFSGRNKSGGRPIKDSTHPVGYSQYFIREKLIFYKYPKMIEYAENELKITNNEHGLKCKLPCCKDVKSLKGINRDIWNYSVVRPHYALNMNEIIKEISRLINSNTIQDAKKIVLLSDLCVLKHLIPDV